MSRAGGPRPPAGWEGVAALAAALSLAGCALGPRVPAPAVTLPAAYEAPPAATERVAIDRWWELYGDPQLAALVDQALARAPDARMAQARLAEALAVRSEALADYAPKGGVQAAPSYTSTQALSGPAPVTIPGFGTLSLTNSGATVAYGVSFPVTWELDLFGRRFAARKAADGDLTAARFEYEAARAALAAQVADQLFQARGLALQLEDARRTSAIDGELVAAAGARSRAGVAAAPDVDQAEAEAAQADAQAAELDGELRAARRTLLVLLGRGGDPLASLAISPRSGALPAMPAALPGDLLQRRPDVREAAARIVAASGKLKLDELALFPRFTLQSGLSLASALSLGVPLTTASRTAGVGVYQPVFEIPRVRAEIRAQGARAEQAVIAYEKAVQTAYGEAESLLGRRRDDETRLSRLAAGEAHGRAAFEAARGRYAAGVDDFTALLVAERSWRSARTTLATAQTEALRRSVQTFKALGGGWTAA